MRKIAAIIVAGGKGERASAQADKTVPKQYQLLLGQPVLFLTLNAFCSHAAIDLVLPVIGANDGDHYARLHFPPEALAKLRSPVYGGGDRQASVLAGLKALKDQDITHVLIHDGARPLVRTACIDAVIDALSTHYAVLPCVPVTETIKRSTDGVTVLKTEDRKTLFAAQTPQGFSFRAIYDASLKASQSADTFTDDASIAEWAGIAVVLTTGDVDNIKITLPGDFDRAAHILEKRHIMPQQNFETRLGSGFDVHPFVPGDGVTLGGVAIPHTAKLKGHSDADAALHVLTDALLGALAEGDIGTHFPPSDEQWKGEPSRTFLSFAAKRVAERGGRIVNLDLTIVCEYPKIGPYVAAMRESIAQICNIALDRVSVKATTSEKMGFIGREEGLATIGSASVELPRPQE